MSEARRLGGHPNEFSREIRSISGGGTIPDHWQCRVIDLDNFYLFADQELFKVKTEGRLWAWYRLPVHVVAVAEQKSDADPQQAWDVTRALALQAGIEGFRVVEQRDGRCRVTDTAKTTDTFASIYEFVLRRIKPLIEPPRDWVDDYVAEDPFMAAEEHPDYEPPF